MPHWQVNFIEFSMLNHLSSEPYMAACFKAWLQCETCIFMELNTDVTNKEVLYKCMECSEACFSLLFELACRPAKVQEVAKACEDSCASCARICEAYPSPELQRCAFACRNCLQAIREMLLPFSLN
jgi:hypothetical protein